MRQTLKRFGTRAVAALALCIALSTSSMSGNQPGQGPLKCLPLGTGCLNCADNANLDQPWFCNPGGPGAPFIQGSCYDQAGICRSWASYLCGEVTDCRQGVATGIPCDTLEFCLNQ